MDAWACHIHEVSHICQQINNIFKEIILGLGAPGGAALLGGLGERGHFGRRGVVLGLGPPGWLGGAAWGGAALGGLGERGHFGGRRGVVLAR